MPSPPPPIPSSTTAPRPGMPRELPTGGAVDDDDHGSECTPAHHATPSSTHARRNMTYVASRTKAPCDNFCEKEFKLYSYCSAHVKNWSHISVDRYFSDSANVIQVVELYVFAKQDLINFFQSGEIITVNSVVPFILN